MPLAEAKGFSGSCVCTLARGAGRGAALLTELLWSVLARLILPRPPGTAAPRIAEPADIVFVCAKPGTVASAGNAQESGRGLDVLELDIDSGGLLAGTDPRRCSWAGRSSWLDGVGASGLARLDARLAVSRDGSGTGSAAGAGADPPNPREERTEPNTRLALSLEASLYVFVGCEKI